jgi:indolepyruvate ferredoxin oxidoreductase alpha subunit
VTVRLGPAFAIAPSRCNRCGACLRLDCGAIFDEGGEALVVDPSACSGCTSCGAVCRSRAIGPTGPDVAPAHGSP